MRASVFSYELPEERVAQFPLADREAARLLVVRPGAALEHRAIRELAELVPEGALVVVNDSRVLPARLLGTRADTGGKVEVLLVRRVRTERVDFKDGARDAVIWRAIGRASKPLRPGSELIFGQLRARILVHGDDDGLFDVALASDGAPVDEALRTVGHVPLPPYIRRADAPEDQARYQTVYARVDGSIAAPTAGLHLSTRLLGELEKRCELAAITLHVGLGTFRPVTASDLDEHPMHAEVYEIPQRAADAVRRARERGKPVVAVGTTVVRALESAADVEYPGLVRATSGETRLLIQPGYRFRVVDGLLTNFHLPRSTLLALVCAFAGTEQVLAAYAAAVREGYRFFSYGDAMLLYAGEL